MEERIEARNSIALEGPTASQRGGRPKPEAKLYFLPGEGDAALAEVKRLYQDLLDWEPAEKAQ